MQLITKNFGQINFDENQVITFDCPLSGLPNSTKYIILSKDEDLLFFWLQSVDEPSLCLCMIDMFKIMPDYNPEVAEFKLMALGDVNFDDIKTYNIVVIPENIKDMSVNLLAPVVINEKTKKGAQLITSNDHEISFKIFDKLNTNKEENGGAK